MNNNRNTTEIVFDFINLVEDLKANENIEVLNAHFFSPAPQGELSNVNDLLGRKLDDDITNFYKETNGMQIRWIYKNNPRFNPHQHKEFDSPFTYIEPMTEEFNYDGCVNILPLNEVFFDIDWGNSFWFEEDEGKNIHFMNQEYDLLFLKQHIRPFDLYSRSSSMAFITASPSETLKAVLLQSYYLDFNTSRLTDFTSYLEFVLANKASTKQRNRIYNEINGHMKEPIVTTNDYWTKDNTFKI